MAEGPQPGMWHRGVPMRVSMAEGPQPGMWHRGVPMRVSMAEGPQPGMWHRGVPMRVSMAPKGVPARRGSWRGTEWCPHDPQVRGGPMALSCLGCHVLSLVSRSFVFLSYLLAEPRGTERCPC